MPGIGAALGAVARAAGGAPAIEKVAVAVDKLAGAGKQALGSITGLASSLTGGLLSPLDAIRGLMDSIGNLVGLFNPGIVAQFNLALNDTMAVLGSALVPVLQGMTVYVKAFGDVLAGLLPVIQPLFDAIGQYIANYAQGFLPIIQAAAPFIQLFADTLALLLKELGKGVAFMQGVVAELITTVAALFGLESRFKAGNAAGFAARQVRVSTVAQFADDVFASNAKNVAGRGQGQRPEALLQEIRDAMQGGREVVQRIAAKVNEIYQVGVTVISIIAEMTPGGKEARGRLDAEVERERKLEEERRRLDEKRRAIQPQWK